MGMDMYIEKIRRNPNDKSVIVERETLCYWRKFWDLHYALALYGVDDYANDVHVTKADVEKAIDFATRNEDYWGGFDSVPTLCELLRDFDQHEADGYEIVYNANW